MEQDWHTQKFNATSLINMGYRKTSGRYRIISRIDDPDWLAVMAKLEFRNITPNDGGRIEDYYRRCLSQDIIENVPLDIFRLIPGSTCDNTGYVNTQPYKRYPLL